MKAVQQPLVSIIVPIYKVEPYLRQCIDSLLAQSFHDFELILVDDGSPDDCGKIIAEFAQKDSRIIPVYKENGGVSSARNAGLDICRGKYVVFCDGDDYVKTDYISSLLNASITDPSILVVSNYTLVHPDGSLGEHQLGRTVIELDNGSLEQFDMLVKILLSIIRIVSSITERSSTRTKSDTILAFIVPRTLISICAISNASGPSS